jgi:two-component system chemotaxis response regulator CheY
VASGQVPKIFRFHRDVIVTSGCFLLAPPLPRREPTRRDALKFAVSSSVRSTKAAMADKVLVIDDSETVRLQVRRALAASGYQVVEAVDGAEGLETIRRLSDLSLALCDINMPRLGGLEMLEQLHREGSKLPILMLTTEGQPLFINRAKKAGAKGWIVKPV